MEYTYGSSDASTNPESTNFIMHLLCDFDMQWRPWILFLWKWTSWNSQSDWYLRAWEGCRWHAVWADICAWSWESPEERRNSSFNIWREKRESSISHMAIVVQLMICELELIETDNLFHPLGTPRWWIGMNMNPKQKYTIVELWHSTVIRDHPYIT